MLPRQSGKVQGGVETGLVEEIIPAEEPSRVLHAPLHPVTVGGAEEIVAGVHGVERRDAARCAVLAVDREPGGSRQEVHVLVAVGHVESAEYAEKSPERDGAAAADLAETGVVGLAPEQGEPERPRVSEKPRLCEVERVAIGARACLDIGRENLTPAKEIAGRIRRL